MPEQIPVSQLVKGKWYVGRGRNRNVGFWNGNCFLIHLRKAEPYYDQDEGCFQPFGIVDEGIMVETFGKVGWDNHYGRRMEFGKGWSA